MRCPFPLRPSTKTERSDYAMIEESVLENERIGNFTRVYPSELHTQTYRNFFEEERRNDNILHNYVFHQKYKNMPIDQYSQESSQMASGRVGNRMKMSGSDNNNSINCNSARKVPLKNQPP